MPKNKAALEKAIRAAGGLTALAEKLEVRPQAVHNWRTRGVPAERVLEIEKATVGDGGDPAVTRHDLRPDLYPVEVAAS